MFLAILANKNSKRTTKLPKVNSFFQENMCVKKKCGKDKKDSATAGHFK